METSPSSSQSLPVIRNQEIAVENVNLRRWKTGRTEGAPAD